MTGRVLLGVSIALAAVAVIGVPTGAAPPGTCPGGRFRITEGPLLAVGEVLVVEGSAATLTSGCAGGRVRARGRRDGTTRLTVRFATCPSGGGKVILRGRLVDACARFEGSARTPRLAPRTRHVVAERSTCGDGVLDAGGGEACDQADAPACPGACAADCTCPPSTTTTTLPPPPTGIFLLTESKVIARVDAASPQTLRDVHLVTGLVLGERLIGIDVRPASGELFAVGAVDMGATAALRLYRVDLTTGLATSISATPVSVTDGGRWGLDFNPIVDRLRIVSDANENLRLNPTTGARADAPVNDTNLSPVGNQVIAVAYDRNVTGGAPTDSTLYAIGRTASSLHTIGGVNQTPSPNGGVLMTVGALGIALSSSADGGLDVFGAPGTAYAALTDATERTALYTIDLATGAATEVGVIGDGTTSVVGLAVAPGGPGAP
jgi:hypothetical protein